jgi:hypothetical protein
MGLDEAEARALRASGLGKIDCLDQRKQSGKRRKGGIAAGAGSRVIAASNRIG